MLKVTVIHVGNLKESYYKEAVDEYAKRLSAYCKFSSVEIKESPLPENPSESEIAKALEKEAEMILSAVPKKAYTVALCVEGKALASEELAKLVSDTAMYGCDSLIFSRTYKHTYERGQTHLSYNRKLIRAFSEGQGVCKRTYKLFENDLPPQTYARDARRADIPRLYDMRGKTIP